MRERYIFFGYPVRLEPYGLQFNSGLREFFNIIERFYAENPFRNHVIPILRFGNQIEMFCDFGSRFSNEKTELSIDSFLKSFFFLGSLFKKGFITNAFIGEFSQYRIHVAGLERKGSLFGFDITSKLGSVRLISL